MDAWWFEDCWLAQVRAQDGLRRAYSFHQDSSTGLISSGRIGHPQQICLHYRAIGDSHPQLGYHCQIPNPAIDRPMKIDAIVLKSAVRITGKTAKYADAEPAQVLHPA